MKSPPPVPLGLAPCLPPPSSALRRAFIIVLCPSTAAKRFKILLGLRPQTTPGRPAPPRFTTLSIDFGLLAICVDRGPTAWACILEAPPPCAPARALAHAWPTKPQLQEAGARVGRLAFAFPAAAVPCMVLSTPSVDGHASAWVLRRFPTLFPKFGSSKAVRCRDRILSNALDMPLCDTCPPSLPPQPQYLSIFLFLRRPDDLFLTTRDRQSNHSTSPNQPNDAHHDGPPRPGPPRRRPRLPPPHHHVGQPRAQRRGESRVQNSKSPNTTHTLLGMRGR